MLQIGSKVSFSWPLAGRRRPGLSSQPHGRLVYHTHQETSIAARADVRTRHRRLAHAWPARLAQKKLVWLLWRFGRWHLSLLQSLLLLLVFLL